MKVMSKMCVAFVVALGAMGAYFYNTSYIDNNRYWGIPFHTTRDAAGLLAISEGQEDMKKKLNGLPSTIAKQREQVLALAEQQKYLYHKLLNATADLEKNSHLGMSLIERMGPVANLFLRDLTKTPDAIQAIGTYEANLPPDSDIRNVMSDLRLALGQEPKSKSEFLEKLSKWRADEAEKEAKRDYERMMNPPPPPPPQDNTIYLDPNYVEPAPQPEQPIQDINYRTSTVISGDDSILLGKTHWIESDIQMVQVKMAQLATTIVKEYELIDTYKMQLALESGDTTLKVGAQMPVKFMFVRDRSQQILQVDQPLYECRVGTFWCSQVGTIKGISGEKAKAPLPTSGTMQDGFLIPIELTDPSAGRAKILFIYEPPTR